MTNTKTFLYIRLLMQTIISKRSKTTILSITYTHSCTQTYVLTSYADKVENIRLTELVDQRFKTVIFNLFCTDNISGTSLFGLFSLLITAILSELHQKPEKRKLNCRRNEHNLNEWHYLFDYTPSPMSLFVTFFLNNPPPFPSDISFE